jgi:hypothetical protein
MKIKAPNQSNNPTHSDVEETPNLYDKYYLPTTTASMKEKHNLQKKLRNMNIKKLPSLSLPSSLVLSRIHACKNFKSAHLTLK